MRARLLIAGLGLAALAALGRLGRPSLLGEQDFSRAIVDADGRLLRLTLAGDDAYRLWVPLADIAPSMVEATLLYEDRAFWWHPGVNPVALAKAFAQTYLAGGRRRGGSTLTMQLARMRFGLDTRRPLGKVLQVARAVQLELGYSKAELLEAYLNLAPYGGNVSGVGAASRVYFHKDAAALSLPEAMALAVLPQNPTVRRPVGGDEPSALRDARRRLAAMLQRRHPELPAEALAADARLELFTAQQLPFLAPHAVDAVLSRRPAGPPTPTIALTLRRALQLQVERQVAAYVARHGDVGLRNAAALLVDAETARVVAHVGSANFFDASIQGQVDGASAPRSPGSSLKPFVYARALDEGLIHPLTQLRDVPMRFGSYSPENFDAQYLGPLSAQEALTRSRNVPAVELNQRLTTGLYEVLSQVEVRGLKAKDFYGAGIVLGAVELSMEELAALYVALANGGLWRPLVRVASDGAGAPRRLVSPEAAELVLDMLASDTAPLGAGAPVGSDRRIAWKTGTSYAYRDAWTAGVAGHFVLVVWVGNFDGEPNPAFVGRTAAAPLFFELLEGLRPMLGAQQPVPRSPPLQLAEMRVCARSGRVPGPHCPHSIVTRIIPGVSPIETCDVHRLLQVDAAGRRSCLAVPGATRAELREVWSSDVVRVFEGRGGSPRAVAPEAGSDCVSVADVDARPPRILSPQPGMTYALRRGKAEEGVLPLVAHADGEARSVTWFAGSELLGTVAPGKALEWAAASGRYELRAVDDRGGVAQVIVTVRWLD